MKNLLFKFKIFLENGIFRINTGWNKISFCFNRKEKTNDMITATDSPVQRENKSGDEDNNWNTDLVELHVFVCSSNSECENATTNTTIKPSPESMDHDSSDVDVGHILRTVGIIVGSFLACGCLVACLLICGSAGHRKPPGVGRGQNRGTQLNNMVRRNRIRQAMNRAQPRNVIIINFPMRAGRPGNRA